MPRPKVRETVEDCQLEIDFRRGVLYVHCEDITRLRICRIPEELLDVYRLSQFMDITLGITPSRKGTSCP